MSLTFQQTMRNLDVKPFLKRSNGLALLSLCINYGLIGLALSLPALYSHWSMWILAMVLLGNRQLGLGILMHDCAHSALFKSKRANKIVGEWLCAAPIFAQFEGYRQYHLQHHAKAGTDADPDYPNYRPYPVNKVSLLRKVLRDLLGITGLKNFFAVLLMHSGLLPYDMTYKSKLATHNIQLWPILTTLAFNLYRPIVMHGLLLGLLMLLGVVELYALWWLAYFTTFSLFSRIRNAAEHANVIDLLDKDPRRHARTVRASWMARLTVAPNSVNYHIEHHWWPQVPPYRLASLHRYLTQQGVLEGAEVLPNYWSVLRKLA